MPPEALEVSTERKRFLAVVYGRVQGVNFRHYTCEKAQRLGLAGYVRNDWNGTVEVMAEGTADAVEKLLQWLHVGPSLAHVVRVQVTWQTPQGDYDDFEVRG